MKTFSSIISTFLLLLFTYPGEAQNPVSAELIKKVEGFSHPESVVQDKTNGVLYISNIGKKEPGDGFISKVTKDGEIIELQWITGLNDPKGLLVKNGTLYVTDVTELVEMDIQTGKITDRIGVKEAVSLNDLTIDEQGTLYISDSGASGIYKMDPSGKISQWLKSEDLEYSNGLLSVDDNIYVAAWGRDNPGNLLKVNRENKEIERISSEGIGNLDGIQQTGNGDFYISDWATGTIYRIDEQGDQSEILTSEKSAGDILLLEQENLLILPMNLQNAVWWYELN